MTYISKGRRLLLILLDYSMAALQVSDMHLANTEALPSNTSGDNSCLCVAEVRVFGGASGALFELREATGAGLAPAESDAHAFLAARADEHVQS